MHRLHTHNTWILIKFKSCILHRTHYNNPWWESQVFSQWECLARYYLRYLYLLLYAMPHIAYLFFPNYHLFFTAAWVYFLIPDELIHHIGSISWKISQRKSFVPFLLDCRFSILNISKITSKSYIQISWTHLYSGCTSNHLVSIKEEGH